MFRKLKNKNLFIVFVVLAVVVGILLFTESKRGERNFKSELVAFDTAEVTGIYVTPKASAEPSLKLEKVKGQWVVVQNNNDYRAQDERVSELLNTLLKLSPKSLTATKKERWKQYEVTDSLATRVVVKGKKDKKLADIYIGKFEYTAPQQTQNQMQMYGQRRPQGTMQTHVRNAGEQEVYLVEGFLNMTFNRGWEDFRDNTIIKSTSTRWTKLAFNYPADSSFTLQKENDTWLLNGTKADSTKVTRFLNKLDFQSGNEFVDNPVTQTSNPVFSLRIEGNNMDPVEVNAYPADSVHQYLIHSTQNRKAYFSSSDGNLADNIFVPARRFMSATDVKDE
ncbi:MAG: DUF4340 domain-containing protein [Bacteroidetes bacterium]|jgi:hypothetical protein|nr:DUF4340 domain-containing protein [Bacteroidota bacterium]